MATAGFLAICPCFFLIEKHITVGRPKTGFSFQRNLKGNQQPRYNLNVLGIALFPLVSLLHYQVNSMHISLSHIYIYVYRLLAIYRRVFAEKSHRTSGSSDRTSNSIQQPWFLKLRLMFPVWQSATPQLKLGRSWEHRLIVSHQHSSFFRNCHGPSPFILEMPFSSFYLSSLRLTPGIPRIPWLQLPPVATCSNHSQRGPSLAALIFSRVDVKSNTSPTNPKTRSTYGIPWGENMGKLSHVMPCPIMPSRFQK